MIPDVYGSSRDQGYRASRASSKAPAVEPRAVAGLPRGGLGHLVRGRVWLECCTFPDRNASASKLGLAQVSSPALAVDFGRGALKRMMAASRERRRGHGTSSPSPGAPGPGTARRGDRIATGFLRTAAHPSARDRFARKHGGGAASRGRRDVSPAHGLTGWPVRTQGTCGHSDSTKAAPIARA